MKTSSLAGAALVLATATASLAAPSAVALPSHSASHGSAAARHIPFTEATVTAGDDGSFRIAWKSPGVQKVTVRAGGRAVAHGGSSGDVTVRGLKAADRQWFDLVPERGGSLHLADRLIKLDGTVNVRDAGGYRTSDGHWVRMGAVYRSDALDKLTTADLAKLKRLGIRSVYDLRMESERTSAPDRVPAGATYHVADVMGASSPASTLPTSEAAAVAMMVEGEKYMVSGATAQAAFSSVYAGVADDDRRGVLYHCTAGKDRTGWSTAALLTALGVPRSTVTSDYLASNTYRAEANAAALAAMPAEQAKVYKPLLDVRAEYLNSGFDEVRDSYGSFGTYLRKGLGIDARELRDLKSDLLIG
ncbi:tyrosine-protein phosphatase [uncultured Streptomyces sp.]|uniref:tyrosine-protein phosphatase n=1 Tax=uncultured Streptomyces sp. TaxID=174707 RepID=UPI00262C599F|nr:tyrosine-protein phosphatase [uncultured Streptomyces sp.]